MALKKNLAGSQHLCYNGAVKKVSKIALKKILLSGKKSLHSPFTFCHRIRYPLSSRFAALTLNTIFKKTFLTKYKIEASFLEFGSTNKYTCSKSYVKNCFAP